MKLVRWNSLGKWYKLTISFFFQTLRKFVAYIDPDNKFAVEDKLSQVNTLEQLSNIASYGFLKKRLETHDLHVRMLKSIERNLRAFFELELPFPDTCTLV